MAIQQQEVIPAAQSALYGVALSLDSFLVNGIQYGILHQTAPLDFLQQPAASLLRELTGLEGCIATAPNGEQRQVQELFERLRATCQRLIEAVTELGAFRSFSLDRVRSAVAELESMRQECVRLLQLLERQLRLPRPFYSTRSGYAATMVADFMANLGNLFEAEWAAAQR